MRAQKSIKHQRMRYQLTLPLSVGWRNSALSCPGGGVDITAEAEMGLTVFGWRVRLVICGLAPTLEYLHLTFHVALLHELLSPFAPFPVSR